MEPAPKPSGFTLRMKNSEDKAADEAARWIKELGPDKSIERFFRKLSKANTRKAYSHALVLYFRWLRTQRGVALSPDELVRDNLTCVFSSQPEQVETKRRHTDWMDEYLNKYSTEVKQYSDSQRGLIYAAISQFYKRNDSPLFGDFSLARGQPTKPPKPLKADDIRKVLKTMPISSRAPLLCMWQSGIEINRILSLRWGDVTGSCPLKVELLGRKIHRKPYASFLGRDSIELLGVWRETWVRYRSREPTEEDYIFQGKHKALMDPTWFNTVLKRTAGALHRQGLIENGSVESWHTHFLRHSFETEASHAGVKAEFRDYFLGHVSGIQWLYNHRDELHPEDLAREYAKIEPFVSLDPDGAALRREFEGREFAMKEEFEQRLSRIERQMEDRLAIAPASTPGSPPASPRAGSLGP
jgi:integrase